MCMSVCTFDMTGNIGCEFVTLVTDNGLFTVTTLHKALEPGKYVERFANLCNGTKKIA